MCLKKKKIRLRENVNVEVSNKTKLMCFGKKNRKPKKKVEMEAFPCFPKRRDDHR